MERLVNRFQIRCAALESDKLRTLLVLWKVAGSHLFTESENRFRLDLGMTNHHFEWPIRWWISCVVRKLTSPFHQLKT